MDKTIQGEKNMNYEEEIKPYRLEINRLNKEIINLIKERVQAAIKIGDIKQSYGKPIVDKAREEIVIDQVSTYSKNKGLDPERVAKIFREIIQLCVDAEKAA
jgi:chorismate mutase/prephenate dehydratase